jgi:hypothetical protein
MEYSDETRAKLPEIAGVPVARSLNVINPDLNNPTSQDWDKAFSLFDLLLQACSPVAGAQRPRSQNHRPCTPYLFCVFTKELRRYSPDVIEGYLGWCSADRQVGRQLISAS